MYVKKFFVISGSVAGIYLVLAVAVTVTLIAADGLFFPAEKIKGPSVDISAEEPLDEELSPTPSPTPEDDGLLKPPSRTHFLFIALDKDGVLTDALMAGCFYRDSLEIKLMSIPRDMYTRLPKERLERMREDNLHPPASGVMKINALRSYGGGRNSGNKYLLEQLSDMLGVEFDYYVEVDIPAFKKIVTLLGGVEMEIPAGGLYYDDPAQNLHIAIPGGMQYIDGETAEGLVRFRRYRTGDLGRNAMQMEFMKQLFSQALRKEVITADPGAFIDIVLNDVRTNIGLDVVKYIPYVPKLTADKLTTHTLPGTGQYINDASYFLPDTDALPEAVSEVFFAAQALPEEDPEEASDTEETSAEATPTGTQSGAKATEATPTGVPSGVKATESTPTAVPSGAKSAKEKAAAEETAGGPVE